MNGLKLTYFMIGTKYAIDEHRVTKITIKPFFNQNLQRIIFF